MEYARFFCRTWQCLLLLIVPVGLVHSAEDLFTIATFNAEWLGHPQSSGSWYQSRSAQILAAAEEIIDLEADIVALQEVVIDPVNGNALDNLLTALNDRDAGETWAGAYNPKFSYWWDTDFSDYPAQRQAYVWKTSTVQYVSSEAMLDWLGARDQRFGSGRLPFLLKVEVGKAPFKRELQLINLHLKCCRGFADRRLYSMTTLLDELHDLYADSPLVVLGDFNVADRGGANGEIREWGFYDDDDADGSPDFAHVGGAVADLSWSDIDHIMVSNELEPDWMRVPASLRNGTAVSQVSDHSPVYARLALTTLTQDRYSEWQIPYTMTSSAFAAKSGFDEDPDKDGLANYLEFMVGTSPVHKDAIAEVLKIQPGIGGTIQLSYRRRQDMPDSSLGLWSRTGFSNQNPWTPMTATGYFTFVNPDKEPGFDRITVLLGPPNTPAPLVFRLQATVSE